MPTAIRAYRPEDLPAVYDICVRTAAGGGDARGLYRSDDLVPDIFAGPYVHLEPRLAFVVDDGVRAVGYVVGCADTAEFARAFRERWLPRVADRYGPPPSAPVTADDAMVTRLHHPERMVRPELAAYPAHLHVDLLPQHQGAGLGRALIHTFLVAAASAGAPAVHLGVDPANTGARAFYDRLGFREIPVRDAANTIYLGRPTREA